LIQDDIVSRIVDVAQPDQIIMFGSAARGEMRPDSDVDLLVIKQGSFHRRRLAQEIYRRLHGVGQAVDVIVVTPADVERDRSNHGSFIKPAMLEGRVIYGGDSWSGR
jgi:predicted nucleotidyltransferase